MKRLVMTMIAVACLLSLTGCAGGTDTELILRVGELTARVETLEAEVDALQAQLASGAALQPAASEPAARSQGAQNI